MPGGGGGREWAPCAEVKEALGARSLFELYNRLANGLHRNVHNLLGGVFGCPAPVAEIYRVNPSWAASYVEPFLLEGYGIISVWMELIVTGVMTCPEVCDVSMRFEDCLCSCPALTGDASTGAGGFNVSRPDDVDTLPPPQARRARRAKPCAAPRAVVYRGRAKIGSSENRGRE